VKLPNTIESLVSDPDAARVFGQPYETTDGTTVIPVAKVRGRRARPGTSDDQNAVRMTARPLGVFVVKDGTATWQPAVDATRIAVLGEIIGLVAATLAGLAMVRRPPWPNLWGDVSRRIEP
jgi:hypothetical protein